MAGIRAGTRTDLCSRMERSWYPASHYQPGRLEDQPRRLEEKSELIDPARTSGVMQTGRAGLGTRLWCTKFMWAPSRRWAHSPGLSSGWNDAEPEAPLSGRAAIGDSRTRLDNGLV